MKDAQTCVAGGKFKTVAREYKSDRMNLKIFLSKILKRWSTNIGRTHILCFKRRARNGLGSHIVLSDK